MVLGASDVRLIDMTRAFASVANKGVAVTPFGILRVTANGVTIYENEVDRSRVLVAPYVAAEMTDLLQTAVATGTGRAAQIGRPVAGKTGTTSSNKDGWFLGFSSGLTTGVWMGRDDAKPVGGLQGGRAPAQAFAAFMKTAVAKRPVEPFETEVTLPEWQLEPDEESYFGQPDNDVSVDEFGEPAATVEQPEPGDEVEIGPDGEPLGQEDRDRLDQGWLDRALGRRGRDGPPAAAPTPRVSGTPTPRPSPRPSPLVRQPVEERPIP